MAPASTTAGSSDALAVLLHALTPPSVAHAERQILSGHASEEAVRRLLEFHQGIVGPVAAIFAFALPTEAALDAVARWSSGGIVEVGAGEGLWAWMLRRRGLAVHAFDTARGRVPYDGQWGATVQQGGPSEAAAHSSCSLLLCWPPLELECSGGEGGGEGGRSSGQGGSGEHENLMALSALRAYQGDVLVYVGEWRGGSGVVSELSWRTAAGQTGGPSFQGEVERHWELAELLPLPRWPGFADCLRIFRRSGAAVAPSAPATAAPAAAPVAALATVPAVSPAAVAAAGTVGRNCAPVVDARGARRRPPPQLGCRLREMQRLGLCQPAAVAAAVWVARLMGEC